MMLSVASPLVTSWLLAVTPTLPLALASAWIYRPWRIRVARLLPWAALPALLTSILVAPGAQVELKQDLAGRDRLLVVQAENV